LDINCFFLSWFLRLEIPIGTALTSIAHMIDFARFSRCRLHQSLSLLINLSFIVFFANVLLYLLKKPSLTETCLNRECYCTITKTENLRPLLSRLMAVWHSL
jgi:hypothetical protein